MNDTARFSCVCLSSLVVLAGTGCSSSVREAETNQATHATDSSEHHSHEHADDHDHPDSYADAVTKLESLIQQTKDAFAAGNPDDAHGPVHEVGHVLEEIPALAKKEPFSAERLVAIEDAVKALFENFHEIDEMFHGSEGKAYGEVADNVNAALQTLKDPTSESSKDM